MTENAIKAIKSSMAELGIEYGFIEYRKNPIVYPYFVGDYIETEVFTEDGMHDGTFILTGFSRGSGAWTALERAKDAIRSYFSNQGRTFKYSDGSVSVVMYGYSHPVPKEDAELKSIQINLTVKEWSVK